MKLKEKKCKGVGKAKGFNGCDKIMTETWKPIKGYEGCYEISDMGRIKTLNRKIQCAYGAQRKINGIIKKNSIDRAGYEINILCKNGNKKNVKIHRLVADHFIQNPENLPIINHINEIKCDNRAKNLEWCTHSYNMRHRGVNKRIAHKNKNGKTSKVLFQYDLSGRLIKKWPSTREAHRMGFKSSSVSYCCNGKYKTYKGFIWRYEKM